uniref:Uncharacterized protein n=1 Tax=Vespula pensylvanica TaxID=30213 RepID=A0A834P5Y2_VESPE|nr:hypothetical protein H0235_006037 [Vespula pensylvanica]
MGGDRPPLEVESCEQLAGVAGPAAKRKTEKKDYAVASLTNHEANRRSAKQMVGHYRAILVAVLSSHTTRLRDSRLEARQ